MTVLALAACAPDVKGGYVIAVDDNGDPLTRLSVPVSSVGQTRVLEVLISNQSELQAKSISMQITGEAANDFMIDPGGCQGVALGPMEGCRQSLTFNSNTVGKRRAVLAITADDTYSLDLYTDVFKP